MEHLYCDWIEYEALCEKLALQLHESAWEFDEILCLARGGLRVGDMLSRVFRRPLGVLFTSSYREGGGTHQGSLQIGESISSVNPMRGPRLLLVDDLVDSGVTLQKLLPEFSQRWPQFKEVRTAVLWQKAGSRYAPNYVAAKLIGDPWIHQPFEKYDRMLPSDLTRT